MAAAEDEGTQRSLRIRVTQDGARVSVRVDVYQGDRLVCFDASRTLRVPLATHDDVTLARKVRAAIEGVVADLPLF